MNRHSDTGIEVLVEDEYDSDNWRAVHEDGAKRVKVLFKAELRDRSGVEGIIFDPKIVGGWDWIRKNDTQ